jgi:aryl-alcohol dehydrogenase-like predicted oxidoreductase
MQSGSSVFALGTAQFGVNYGITNESGKPHSDEIFRILDFAKSQGISSLDSAFAYGSSLEVLAEYIQEKKYFFYVINKFSILDDLSRLEVSIENWTQKSATPFEALLVHDPQRLSEVSESKVKEFVERLKKKKLIRKFGISIYEFEEYKSWTKNIDVEIIQFPLNIFNQDFLCRLPFLKAKGIELHARSLFLQGLLLAQVLPSGFEGLRKSWERYLEIKTKINMSSLELNLAWAKGITEIDKWVVGVNKKDELVEIIETFNRVDAFLGAEVLQIKEHDNSLVDPRKWKKK